MRNLGHLQSRNEWIARNPGHVQSRNESIVRKSGRGDFGQHATLVNIKVFTKNARKLSKKHNVFNISEWKYTNWLGGVAKFGVKKLNGSGNESTARKMARGKTQTAADWRACINFHRKFIWFGKTRVPAREIPLASQKGSPESLKQLGKHTKKLDLRRFWGSLLGI